jgi:hypothetical protein
MLDVSSHASAAQDSRRRRRIALSVRYLRCLDCPAGVGVWLMMSHSALAFWYTVSCSRSSSCADDQLQHGTYMEVGRSEM